MASPEPYCESCQLPLFMCMHGQAAKRARPAQPVTVDWEALADLAEEGESAEAGGTIEARYYGKCRGCGERWSPGDLITYSMGEDGWCCVDCVGL